MKSWRGTWLRQMRCLIAHWESCTTENFFTSRGSRQSTSRGHRICTRWWPSNSSRRSIQTSIRLNLNAATQTGAIKVFQREEDVEIVKPISAVALRAAFMALPHTDENDGQTVVCYRSYFPAAMAAVY